MLFYLTEHIPVDYLVLQHLFYLFRIPTVMLEGYWEF